MATSASPESHILFHHRPLLKLKVAEAQLPDPVLALVQVRALVDVARVSPRWKICATALCWRVSNS